MTIDAQRLYGFVEQLLAAHCALGRRIRYGRPRQRARRPPLATPSGRTRLTTSSSTSRAKARSARGRRRPQGRDRPHRQAH